MEVCGDWSKLKPDTFQTHLLITGVILSTPWNSVQSEPLPNKTFYHFGKCQHKAFIYLKKVWSNEVYGQFSEKAGHISVERLTSGPIIGLWRGARDQLMNDLYTAGDQNTKWSINEWFIYNQRLLGKTLQLHLFPQRESCTKWQWDINFGSIKFSYYLFSDVKGFCFLHPLFIKRLFLNLLKVKRVIMSQLEAWWSFVITVTWEFCITVTDKYFFVICTLASQMWESTKMILTCL